MRTENDAEIFQNKKPINWTVNLRKWNIEPYNTNLKCTKTGYTIISTLFGPKLGTPIIISDFRQITWKLIKTATKGLQIAEIKLNGKNMKVEIEAHTSRIEQEKTLYDNPLTDK